MWWRICSGTAWLEKIGRYGIQTQGISWDCLFSLLGRTYTRMMSWTCIKGFRPCLSMQLSTEQGTREWNGTDHHQVSGSISKQEECPDFWIAQWVHQQAAKRCKLILSNYHVLGLCPAGYYQETTACFSSRLRADLDIIKQQADKEQTDAFQLFNDAANAYLQRSHCWVSHPLTEASNKETTQVECLCKALSCLIV